MPSHGHMIFPTSSSLPSHHHRQGGETGLGIGYHGCWLQRARSAIPLTVSPPKATRNNTERRGLLGPQRNTGPGVFFNHAHGFTLNNTAMTQ
jgi:hypothetical protein